MEAFSDAQLAQQIVSGGARAAEAELCRRLAPRVRLYGLKHLRDEDRARDLVQTVLIAMLEALRAARVEDVSRIDRFVLGTCRFVVARMRQQSGRVPLAAEGAVENLAALPVETVEVWPLFQCLAEIEERARRVLMWSFLEERSTEEIASRLAMPPGSVRVLRHRALAAVRRCLDAREGNQP